MDKYVEFGRNHVIAVVFKNGHNDISFRVATRITEVELLLPASLTFDRLYLTALLVLLHIENVQQKLDVAAAECPKRFRLMS